MRDFRDDRSCRGTVLLVYVPGGRAGYVLPCSACGVSRLWVEPMMLQSIRSRLLSLGSHSLLEGLGSRIQEANHTLCRAFSMLHGLESSWAVVSGTGRELVMGSDGERRRGRRECLGYLVTIDETSASLTKFGLWLLFR